MAAYYRNNYRSRRGYKKYSSARTAPKREPIVQTDQTGVRWQKLLKYYGDCISVENAGEITLYSSKEGVDFLQVPSSLGEEWVTSGKERLEFEGQNEHFQSFINGPRWSRSPLSYFYGFPCHVKHIEQSRRGWSGQIIQPILIFGVDLIQTETGYAFVLQSDRPRINSAFLTDKSLLTSVEERKHIAEAVLEFWDEEKSRGQNIRMILSTFAELLPQEIPFSKDILTGKIAELKTREKIESGIFPMATIFRSTNSPYTYGLEQEVSELRDASVPNEIWRVILDRNTEIKEEENYDGLLEITGLNDEQRSAIKSTFNNTLTVVTGPPGTGKSQIVLNIIANALLHGESVLFGSKNHKAVDVVIERLLRLQTEPVILKYGQKEREVEFAESLLAAIERASSYNAQVLEREIGEYKNELELVRKEEKHEKESLLRILDRRNRISRLDAILEQIKKEVLSSISKELNQYTKIEANSKFYRLLSSLDGLEMELEEGPNFISRILTFFGMTLEERILKKSQKLLREFPIQSSGLVADSIHNCKELLTNARLIKKWIKNQSELTNIVRENESESSVEVLRERITKSKDRAIDISIKYVNALMKRRLKVLGRTERRDIADYISIVRRLESDVTGGELAEELRKERKRMFKSVVRAFPAMAVTNLSVRHALPLSAGIVDVAIIDEASQCDIASALPLLYRAKRAVIIGDPNQLTHISLLHRADDQQLQRQTGLTSPDDQRFLYSINSLFELSRSVIGTGAKFTHLLEHYRSRAEIIGFSNKKFYGGKLSVWTDYRKLRGAGYPDALVWHNIVGEVVRPSRGSAYNLEEAKAVVGLIEEIVERISANGDDYWISLGVVTPFREQANKIRDLVEQKIDTTHLRKLDLVIDTAHKYQGDERDIMIFSPVVSRKTPQRSLGFLGNTVNLFNVAITRARSELHIVGDRIACAQSGIPHLSEFVEYVEALEPENINKCGGKFESPWEEILFDALKREGVRTIPQYPLYQYRLDLAIVDTEIPVDIEIDGELWHRDIDGGRLLSDLKRDQHLIMHGWQVKRFWVYQLQNNLQKCVEEIKEILKQK
jgi:superfamily I DNA and/or RNA helicase/very-short-patch-repair endonuclease